MTDDNAGEIRRQSGGRLKIFVSHAHDDVNHCKYLDKCLKPLGQKITLWRYSDDKNLPSGTEWQKKIDDEMATADIFLLLISVNFYASDPCTDEREKALARQEKGNADIISILLEPCGRWDDDKELKKNEALPCVSGELKPVSKWKPHSGAWNNVYENIKQIVNSRIDGEKKLSNDIAMREFSVLGFSYNNPQILSPASTRNTILAAMLVGRWHADNSNEISLMSELAGMTVKEFLDELESLRFAEIPFIDRRDNVWKSQSRKLFKSWAQALNPEILDRFHKIAVDVLPNVESLPSHISGWVSPRYSDGFKKGISDMIALLAAHGDQNSNWPHSYTIAGRMSVCVRKILASEMPTERWVALDNYLPLLAEAAPDEFLNTVENILSKNPAVILGMFQNQNSLSLSGCRHAGLLWALECLCWHPNYLLRSVMILADLFQQGADSSWENKPINSLTRIFLPWIQNIAASEDDKMEMLDKIITQNQKAAWHLLYSLMPRICDTSTEIRRPQYREWGRDWKQDILPEDYHRYTTFIAGRFLDEFKKSPQCRAEKLLETFTRRLPETYRQKAYRALLKASDKIWTSDEIRRNFGQKLGKMIRHHRQYPDAGWSLPEEELKILDNIYKLVISGDLIERYHYLFDESHPDIPDLKLGDSRDNYRDQDRRREKMRIDAVVELWHAGGWDNIEKIAISAGYSNIVGHSLAKSKISKAAWSRMLECLDSENKSLVDFARGFVFSYAQKIPNWAKSELNKAGNSWSSKRQASFVLGLPAGSDTLTVLKKLPEEAKNLYWQEPFIPLYWSNAKVADVIWVIKQLNCHGRPAISLDTASMFSHNSEIKSPPKLLADTLELLLKSPERQQGNQHLSYNISVAIQILQRDGTLDDERLAKIEREFFDGYAQHKPITLGKKIVREPEFLANLIAQVYYPKDAKIPEGGSLESQNARQAFDILQYFGGSAFRSHGFSLEWDNAAQAKNWAREVRKICVQNGREEPGDHHIGKILSNTGDGADGIWPSDIAREVLEDQQNSNVEDGMVNGRLNQRGVVWRSAKGGGEQENKLADNYERAAESLREKWPRAAKVLRELSESYRGQARREDNQRRMDDF